MKNIILEDLITPDFPTHKIIPQEEDFKALADLISDKDNSRLSWVRFVDKAEQIINNDQFKLVRWLIASAMFREADGTVFTAQPWVSYLRDSLKHKCLRLGYSLAELKMLVGYAKTYQDKFDHYYEKYCEAVVNGTYVSTAQAENPIPATQSNSQTNSNNINIKQSAQPNATFCRIVAYDPKYLTPARRHIYLTKKQNGSYKVSIGSAEVTSWFNEPLFDSVAQAENFIKNIKNASTKTNPETFNFTITDKPVKDWKTNLISDLSNCVLVISDCGPAYIHRKNKYCVEGLIEEVEIEEAIEKHEELNPALFNEDATLKTEVKDKINEIVDEFLKDFIEVEVDLKVKDIILTGSNASYNYTKDSDLDIHIIADISEMEDTAHLYKVIYDAYKSAFNKKFDIELNSVPVEIYVETQDTPLVSNGIYSIINDAWVKEPTKESIPEVDQEAIDKAFKPWEKRYKVLLTKIDDELKDESEIDSFIDKLYELRQKGLAEDGEYSIGNLVFKEMRNLGYLDNLKELRHKVIAQRLSLHESLEKVESLTECLNILNKLN